MNGNALVHALGGVEDLITPKKGGVLFNGNIGSSFGHTILPNPLTVPAGHTLTIPTGAVLVVPSLVNNGSIIENGKLIVLDAAPPSLAGETGGTLTEGYPAASTAAYMIGGYAPVNVTKVHGDAAFSWNNSTKKLEIAAGLPAGVYPVILQASNYASPDAVLMYTLTVQPAQTSAIVIGDIQINGEQVFITASGCTPGGLYEIIGTPTFEPLVPGVVEQADESGEVEFVFDKPGHGTYFFKVKEKK